MNHLNKIKTKALLTVISAFFSSTWAAEVTTHHFPPYSLIKETFERRLEERDRRGENVTLSLKSNEIKYDEKRELERNYINAHKEPSDDAIFYSVERPAIYVVYEDIKYLCRMKDDHRFIGERYTQLPEFKGCCIEINYDESFQGKTPRIQADYNLINSPCLYVLPLIPAQTAYCLGLPLEQIKNSYFLWYGRDGDDSFQGYSINYKHGIHQPSDAPFLKASSPGPLDDVSQQFADFIHTDEAERIDEENRQRTFGH